MTMRYSFGQIEALKVRIDSIQAQMNSKLDDLKAHVAPMVADWEGSASEAYQAQQAKWDAAALELNQILDAVGRVVGQGNADMQQVNSAAANSWA
ncbi:ESAT-6-like protein [Prescottella defluvii]|uniref:WXG100 family type VII secretion target n=1 Tax=Prescottella defluvii TaxID=1323361 RepID=UPI0004F24DBD|nr:WXG100 family type VII secretion target [Prescottella defluvii]